MDDPINANVGRTKYKTPVPTADMRQPHRQTSYFGDGKIEGLGEFGGGDDGHSMEFQEAYQDNSNP